MRVGSNKSFWSISSAKILNICILYTLTSLYPKNGISSLKAKKRHIIAITLFSYLQLGNSTACNTVVGEERYTFPGTCNYTISSNNLFTSLSSRLR